ncbi:MAG: DUF1285 domain-containing protein [Granulosicoccus sp.]|nr:DUF1285 domain-containing protein [Granulosicoccus sp.]
MSNEAALDSILGAIAGQRLPPVHSWQPQVTQYIDIRIARDGQWFHEGSPIGRPAMVKLFSSVLRVDDDGETYLVTPQLRLRIEVEDAPFTAVLMEQHGSPEAPVLVFTTNVGDRVIADRRHPVHVRYATPDADPAPYLLVRDRLEALISRSVYYQLADLAEERDGVLGVVSAECFMPLGFIPEVKAAGI